LKITDGKGNITQLLNQYMLGQNICRFCIRKVTLVSAYGHDVMATPLLFKTA